MMNANEIELDGVTLNIAAVTLDTLSAEYPRYAGKVTIQFREVAAPLTANFVTDGWDGSALLQDIEGEDAAACEYADLCAEDFAAAIVARLGRV